MRASEPVNRPLGGNLDQVVILVAIETFAGKIADSKAANDARVKTALEVAGTFHIDKKDLQTSELSLAPRYDWDGNHYNYEKVVGYETRRQLSILLRDMSQFEPLISGLLGAGINRIEQIEFRRSDVRMHRDAARAEALKAARQKATDMAAVLGEKVGRPLTIVEDAAGSSSSSWRYDNRNMYSNSSQFSQGGAGPESEALAPGVITIRANVTVTFEIN